MLVGKVRRDKLAGWDGLIGVGECLAAGTCRRRLLKLLEASERRLDNQNPQREDDED